MCLSVPALAASASVGTSNQRYSRVYLRLFLEYYYVWSFEKTFRSKGMAWKSQYANELELTVSSFGTNETHQLREGQLVGRMMLATGATRVKQARRPTLGRARHSHAHAQYIHAVCMNSATLVPNPRRACARVTVVNRRRACARVTVVNPRRACARVTVLVLCVCLCIRLFPL